MTRLRQEAVPGKPVICPECGSADVVIGDVSCSCNGCGESFRTDADTRRRIAQVIHMPIAHRPSFHDADWREQFDRECEARNEMTVAAPPRTRPLVVSHRPEQN